MKTKVVEFIGSIQDGGAETLVKDYMLMLDKEKFDVTTVIIRTSPQSANHNILKKAGARVIPIFRYNFLPIKIIQKVNYSWLLPMRLKKILDQERPDVLHIHLSLIHYVQKIAHHFPNLRIFYTCHNEPKLMLAGKNERQAAAAKKLIKSHGLTAIALHDDMKKEINEMLDVRNTVVINNGIDMQRFQSVQKSKNEIRRELGIPDGAFIIGHVGRFTKQKNQMFLVDILSELRQRGVDAFLLLVGSGENKDEVQNRLVKSGCEGYYSILSHRTDIAEIMHAMDVFVFPSEFEGLGIVMVEAQAADLRCIASDKVPRAAFITEKAIPISLKDPVMKWCDVILDDTVKGPYKRPIDDFDIRKEIKKLEKLYEGNYDV